MPRVFDFIALPAYCGLIFWLSAQERLPMPNVIDFQDKWLHFGAYFAMGVLCVRAFRHCSVERRYLPWFATLFCCLYGLSDEWHQSFVAGREASGWDWLADSLGGATSAWLLHNLGVVRQKAVRI